MILYFQKNPKETSRFHEISTYYPASGLKFVISLEGTSIRPHGAANAVRYVNLTTSIMEQGWQPRPNR